jgi:hypothetical protein
MSVRRIAPRGLEFTPTLVVAGLAWMTPAVAEADLEPCPFALLGARPDDLSGPADAPQNTRIWIGAAKHGLAGSAPEGAAVTLSGAGGAVAITQTKIDTLAKLDEAEGVYTFNDLWVLSPEEPLPAGEYSVRVDDARLLTFTVGAWVDDVAPPVPEVVAIDYEISAGGDVRVAWIELARSEDIVVIEREGGATLDPEGLEGGVADAFEGGMIGFGAGRCVSNWDAEVGDATRIRLGAFDHAGNFSGLSPWIDLEMRRFGCECAAAPDERRLPAHLLFGALLLGRRRRSRRPTGPSRAR